MSDPTEAVRDANSAFYAALEACDLDAMADLWEHSDRVSVTHPGWPMLRGWAKVAGSWDAIFRNTGYIQFVLTDEQVVVTGDAWCTTIFHADSSRTNTFTLVAFEPDSSSLLADCRMFSSSVIHAVSPTTVTSSSVSTNWM